MDTLFADHAWLPDGWQADVHLARTAGAPGTARFATLAPGSARPAGARHARWLLPGLPNLHSHAFQRAMAGLAERQTHPEDSFWTWREVMYGFAAKLTPDHLRDIATMLYVEMLEAGYTSVCEFHYLHHAPDGRPYADAAEMSLALVQAAAEAGIGLTLLPTLYMTGGFDGRPLSERQRRFGHDVAGYLRLVERLRGLEHERLRVGLCFHSLRAVPGAAMREVLEATRAQRLPVHIHIAEQIGEVQDCLALRNARPVEWLLANLPVDARWTLVHATHLSEGEIAALAASKATVALCPTTEANLGDGLFPLRAWLDAGGRWGIGSDSHISVSPVEELRWLEYGQRLHARRRNIAVQGQRSSTGECLFAGALASAAAATGQGIGGLRAGESATRADVVVLDEHAPELAGARAEDLLDRWIFSGNRNVVREVHVGGERVVQDHRHRHRDAVEERYRRTLAALLA
jgi:formimidoylglutamate deiminase